MENNKQIILNQAIDCMRSNNRNKMKIGYINEIKRISKAGEQKAKQKINFLGTNNRNFQHKNFF